MSSYHNVKTCSKCGNIMAYGANVYHCSNCAIYEEKGQNSKDALRYNNGKLDLLQQPFHAWCAFATVVQKNSADYGGKYPNGNFRKGAKLSQYVQSGLRHLFARLTGEIYDKEDGIPHSWKVLWNFAMLVEIETTMPDRDDLSNLGSAVNFATFTQYLNKQKD